MKLIILIFIYLLFENLQAYSQNTVRNPRKLTAEISSGVIFNTTKHFEIPGVNYRNTSAGIAGTIFYESEYFIKIGIESGYLPITGINNQPLTNEYGTTTINSQLSAIPVLFVFSMSYENFQIYYGRGVYLMLSRIDAFGTKSVSNETVAGFNAAFSYKYPVSKNWKIGLQCKYYYISDAGNSLFFTGINVNYTLLSY